MDRRFNYNPIRQYRRAAYGLLVSEEATEVTQEKGKVSEIMTIEYAALILAILGIFTALFLGIRIINIENKLKAMGWGDNSKTKGINHANPTTKNRRNQAPENG